MSARPLGLLLALDEALPLERYLREGGSMRVASATLLDAHVPLSGVHVEHRGPLDEAWRQTCPPAVSAAAERLVERRLALVDLAGAAGVAAGDNLAERVRAPLCVLEVRLDAFTGRNATACAEYVAAYTSLIDAALASDAASNPGVLRPLVNLDLAYWFSEGRVRRARLLPLHPLRFVGALARLELDIDVGVSPSRLAAWHGAEHVLYPEGRSDFFGCDANINIASPALVEGIREGLSALWSDGATLADHLAVSVTLLDVADGVAAIDALVDAAAERLRLFGEAARSARIEVRFARSPDIDEATLHVPTLEEVSERARAALQGGLEGGVTLMVERDLRLVDDAGPADLLVAALRCSLGRRISLSAQVGLHVAYEAGEGGDLAWLGVQGSAAQSAYMRLVEALSLEAQQRAWRRPTLAIEPTRARVVAAISRVWPERTPPGWWLLGHAHIAGHIVLVLGAKQEVQAARATLPTPSDMSVSLEDASVRFYAARGIVGRGASASDAGRALNLLRAFEIERPATPALVLSLDSPEGAAWLASGVSIEVGAAHTALLIVEASDGSATDVTQIRVVIASPLVSDEQEDEQGCSLTCRLAAKVAAALSPSANRAQRATLLHLAWMEASRQRQAREFEAALRALERRVATSAPLDVRAERWLLPQEVCTAWQITEVSMPGDFSGAASASKASTSVRIVMPAGMPLHLRRDQALDAQRSPGEHDEPGEDRAEAPASSPSSSPRQAAWSTAQLRAATEAALGVRSVDDSALTSAAIRRVVAYRRSPLRHHLCAEVRELLSPVLVDPSNAGEFVAEELQALVDLGDLVQRRDSARGPYYVEAASACVLRIPGSNGRMILLGRAEEILPKRLLNLVRCAERLRSIDAGDRAREVEDELRFFGVAPVSFDSWAELPDEVSASILLQHVAPTEIVSRDALPSYEVFDPVTPPAFFRGRLISGRLIHVLERDGWAAARSKEEYASFRYFLFRLADGKVARREVDDRATFLRLAAACAERSSAGRRLLARREPRAVRLYFPPPPWLARLLLLGERLEPGDALEAAALGDDVLPTVVEALEQRMFCEVVRS